MLKKTNKPQPPYNRLELFGKPRNGNNRHSRVGRMNRAPQWVVGLILLALVVAAGTAEAAAPVVSQAIKDLWVVETTPFTLVLPAATFYDADNDTLSVSLASDISVISGKRRADAAGGGGGEAERTHLRALVMTGAVRDLGFPCLGADPLPFWRR